MCILQLTMGSTRRPLFLTKQPKISNNLSLDAELSNSYSNLNVISFISESLALYRMVNTDVQEKAELLIQRFSVSRHRIVRHRQCLFLHFCTLLVRHPFNIQEYSQSIIYHRFIMN